MGCNWALGFRVNGLVADLHIVTLNWHGIVKNPSISVLSAGCLCYSYLLWLVKTACSIWPRVLYQSLWSSSWPKLSVFKVTLWVQNVRLREFRRYNSPIMIRPYFAWTIWRFWRWNLWTSRSNFAPHDGSWHLLNLIVRCSCWSCACISCLFFLLLLFHLIVIWATRRWGMRVRNSFLTQFSRTL